jgi:SAM-dependent methyltransferase
VSEFSAKSLCILGRQPALGLAELESLYGADHVKRLTGAATVDIEAGEINFKRLGGSIKIARLLTTIASTDWLDIKKYLLDSVPKQLQHTGPGKFTLGISAYGLEVGASEINRTNLSIKKVARRPMRVVPNKTPALSSAQVLHNKLTHIGAWELLLYRDGAKTILAQTFFVQDIEAYAARDQVRPKRDARIGMLPPKLAQIIVNLTTGPLEVIQHSEPSGVQGAGEQRTEAHRNGTLKEQPQPATLQSAGSTSSIDGSAGKQARAIRVLDPFCGTGVILQEAMLMGYNVLGTDIDPRMVDYAKENLRWLVANNPKIEAHAAVELADATSARWPRFSVVASELYLGRPLTTLPAPDKLKAIINDVNTITKKFLRNLAPQLKPGQKVCLAVPAWRQTDGKLIHLPIVERVDQLTDMGYNYLDLKHVRRSELIYYREDQTVARQLIRLEKAKRSQ